MNGSKFYLLVFLFGWLAAACTSPAAPANPPTGVRASPAVSLPRPTLPPPGVTVLPASPTAPPPVPHPTLQAVLPAATQALPPMPTRPVLSLNLAPPQQPVALPPGFVMGVYASGLENPRMMTIGPDGQLYAAERGAGRIVRLPDLDQDGRADAVQAVASGLNSPSSLAFYQDGSLYVGETTRVLRLSEPDARGGFQKRDVIVAGLPSGGHNTRTVLFSPDWQTLFVSVGSSCNVCEETDPRRAAIVRYNPDGSGETIFARGLRNAVGITFRPGSNELWATNNGRDMLGDDSPPETVNLAQEGLDFGWPRCHAARIVDPEFGGPGACAEVAPPAIEMQAHSAPLGLAFYTGDQFPPDYQGSLFVAFHGSWNRSVPTGYKVVRIPFINGLPGPVQDFAAGWLVGGAAWGRPADVRPGPDGSLFISDDAGGNIYRVYYTGP